MTKPVGRTPAPPKVKAQKPFVLKPKIEIPRLNRKCRSCARWSKVANEEPCPFCGKPFGRLVLGDDLPADVAPAVDARGFPVKGGEL